MTKIQKSSKIKYTIILVLFGISFISEILLLNPQGELIEDKIKFESNALLKDKKIEISLPGDFYEHEYNPLVILLPGDAVKPGIMSFFKRELILNDIGVITFVSDSSWITFIEIFRIIKLLENHEQLKEHPLGIFGHSHGSHFALLASLMIPDAFSFTICSNFGSYDVISSDLTEFMDNYDSYAWTATYGIPEKPVISELNQYILINKSIPQYAINNLLILANDNDQTYLDFKESLGENSNAFWNINTVNELQGTFEDDTARLFHLGNTIFPHISGLFHPDHINLQLNWITRASGSIPLQTEANFVRNDLILNVIVFIIFIVLFWPSFSIIMKLLFKLRIVDKVLLQDITSIDLLTLNKIGNYFDKSLGIEKSYPTINGNQNISQNLNIEKKSNFLLFSKLKFLWIKVQFQQILIVLIIILILYVILEILLLRWVIQSDIIGYFQDVFFVRSLPIEFEFYYLFLVIYIHDSIKTESVIENKFKKQNKPKIYLKIFGVMVIIGIITFYSYFILYQLINTQVFIFVIMIFLNFLLFYLIIYKINEIYHIQLYKNGMKGRKSQNFLQIKLFLIILLFYSPLIFSIIDPNLSQINIIMVSIVPILLMTIQTYRGISQEKDLLGLTLFNVGVNISRRIYLFLSLMNMISY